SLTLSMLGLGQSTLAEKNYSASEQYTQCLGGTSEKFRVSGQVKESKTFTLSDLQALPASKVTVTFASGQGQETHTYIGVPLWQLIQSVGGLKTNTNVNNVKNYFLRQYVVAEGTDCYQAVVAVGEIEPNFEGKQVLVAYAEEDSSNNQTLLTDQGFARLVVPGDQKGGRYVSNIRRIVVRSAPDLSSKPHYFAQP
ncbi:molybdopterin-dependent oxidoreductase, partial [Aetokthonos hydrillicola]|uniref:molybdopterin-dependent oxidoreductase n=1 Tax=Aetokthonos hydrillicola TaxID=1550245 RepID=UPI001ABB6E04